MKEISVFNIPVQIVSKIDKVSLGKEISKGSVHEALMNQSGYAMLKDRAAVRFSPEEYDLNLPDEWYEEILS